MQNISFTVIYNWKNLFSYRIIIKGGIYMAAGIFGAIIFAVIFGMIGLILLVFGIIGTVLWKKVIFKCLIGIGILCLIVPIGFGSLTGWSAYQSIKDEKRAEKEESVYRKKYPIHAKFQNDCKYGSNFQQLEKLVQEAGDDLNEIDDEGYTILDQFIIEDWYDAKGLKVLLDAGAKRSSKSIKMDGGSLFIVAGYRLGSDDETRTEEEQCQCLKILLDTKENVNRREPEFQNATPLMAASGYFAKEDEKEVREWQKEDMEYRPSDKIIKLLKDAGTDEKLKDDSGRTAADYYEIMIHP